MRLSWLSILLQTLMLVLAVACIDSDGGSDDDGDTETEAISSTDSVTNSDTDTDTDSDTDSDTDTDTDSDTDSDTDTDTDSDTDSDTDTDTDSDTNSGTDTGTDTGTDSETSSDSGNKGNPDKVESSELGDLREIKLDAASTLVVNVRDHTSTGYEEADVHYYLTHKPQIPTLKGISAVDIDNDTTNSNGVSSVKLNPENYYVSIYGFKNVLNDDLNTDGTTIDCSGLMLGAGCNGFNGYDVPFVQTEIKVENTKETNTYIQTADLVTLNIDSVNTDDVLETVTINLYKTDEKGLPFSSDLGIWTSPVKMFTYFYDSTNQPLNDGFAASYELFPGYYRAIVTASGAEDDGTTLLIHPYITDVIAVTGGNDQSVSVALTNNGNDVKLTAKDDSENDIPGSVIVYDCETGWVVNLGPAGASEDEILMGNFKNVIAIFDNGAGLKAGYHFSNLKADSTATLVQGLVDTNGLPSGNDIVGSAYVMFTQYFAEECSYVPRPSVVSAAPSTADGTTNDTAVFGYGGLTDKEELNYWVTVIGMNDYFLDATQKLAMTGVSDGIVNFSATLGGTIAGNILTKNGSNAIEGTSVGAYDKDDIYYGPAISDSNGYYELDVPAGTYTVSVSESGNSGALTKGVIVNSNATTQHNIIRGPYTGDVTRLSDSEGIEDGTFFGTSSTTTDGSGNFTLDFYDGTNFVCINPNTSATGYNVMFECFYNIEVDATKDLDD